MTIDEFKKKYQDYKTTNKVFAILEAAKVNKKLIGGKCVSVKIDDKYCLILDTAFDLMKELEIL